MSFARSILVGLILPSLFVSRAVADEPADTKSDLSNQFLAAAKAYELVAGEDTSLQLATRPILNWTNPERLTRAGSVFLWTDGDGRPATAMCIYPNGEDSFDHEFQSLSLKPIQAKLDVSVVWWPREPGLRYVKLDDVKPPGKGRAIRLTQMRAVARGFSARLVPNNADPKPLRLLPAPLYRYPGLKSDSAASDGAIFAFVQGTDPEALLLVESVRGDKGEAQWRYALARMSMVPIEATRKESVVWTVKGEWGKNDPTRTYYYYAVPANDSPAAPVQ